MAKGAPVPDITPEGAPSGEPTRQAVVDLLGVLAYAELIAFERLADDARLAPTLADKAALAAMAVAEFGHYQRLEMHLRRIGADPAEAMRPFVEPLDAFHDSTAPSDWLESLVKAYVGDNIAADFYREVARYVDAPTRELVLDVLRDTGHASFAIDRVRAAIEADPAVAGRLALWARRLVGEAMAQAQRVAVDREALTDLIVGGASGSGGLAELGRTLARLTDAHAQRMAALGLSS
ncbi:MAG: ferritin-like fold-containing protein [Frankiaceae bacterium]